MPAIEIGKASIQLEYSQKSGDNGRTRFCWVIDLPDGQTFHANDLQSGANGGSLQEGFGSLLSFLSAAGESFFYAEKNGKNGMEGENADLFPEPVTRWASEHLEEINFLRFEIEDTGQVLIEELQNT